MVFLALLELSLLLTKNSSKCRRHVAGDCFKLSTISRVFYLTGNSWRCVYISNGEFEQHEQLTRKITFSATYTIFMNQIFSENAIFTVFSRFLGSFRRFALKNFLPPKKTWKKIRKKILKLFLPGFEQAMPLLWVRYYNHYATALLLTSNWWNQTI